MKSVAKYQNDQNQWCNNTVINDLKLQHLSHFLTVSLLNWKHSYLCSAVRKCSENMVARFSVIRKIAVPTRVPIKRKELNFFIFEPEQSV